MITSLSTKTGRILAATVFLVAMAICRPALAYHVKEVLIEGNQAFDDGQIKKLMRTRGSSWYKKRPLVRRFLELDVANIEAFYHKNGYLDCTVSSQQTPTGEGEEMMVQIWVQEGSRVFVRELSFSGNVRLSDAYLSRGLQTRLHQPLDLSLLRADIGTIARTYGDHGYPYAVALADVQRDSTAARITFQVAEGQPVHIQQIHFRGLKEVRASVVRRELTVASGDLYDRSAIVDSRQRVYSTGLFSFADIHLESEPGDSLHPDLAVLLQERRLRWVGLRTEAGQDEQYDMTADLSAEWGNKNLFSSGRKLSLKATATFRVFTDWENLKNRLETIYTEPWFLGMRMPAWVNVYFEPGLKSKGRSYRVQRFGGEFNISRELGRHSRVWSAVKYEKVDIFGLDPEVAEILRQSAGERIRRYLSLSWERDTRSEIFRPMKGSLTQAAVSFVGGPLGGDDHYVKTQVTWNRYQRLFSPAVLASRIRLGWAREYGAGNEVPVDVRFYAGGASTVRGWKERSLGPLDPAGNPLGGSGLFLFNTELRRPLWKQFGGSLFFDAGAVWEQPRKASPEDLNTSTGLELWLATPVGPIRVAYGVPLVHPLEPAKGRWHMALLFAF